jgi:hypothetical protein
LTTCRIGLRFRSPSSPAGTPFGVSLTAAIASSRRRGGGGFELWKVWGRSGMATEVGGGCAMAPSRGRQRHAWRILTVGSGLDEVIGRTLSPHVARPYAAYAWAWVGF